MLHITNGDSAASTIQQTGLSGKVLPWRDILHEGPTPSGLSLDEMSKLRARFIAAYAWNSYENVLADFAQRDAALAHFNAHKEVVLWFEHDLYDQLQLIQLLAWFAHQHLGQTTLSLICINAFPGIENFKGLGQLSPTQLRSLFPQRHTITQTELNLGSAAWQAYCSPDPIAIEALLTQDTSALPFLKSALLRHLEQFPDLQSGLSRTERHILELVASTISKPVELFLAAQAQEESAYMGDSTFWAYIANLCSAQEPLLQLANGSNFALPSEHFSREDFKEQVLVLTEYGHVVLAGQADWVTSSSINRWLGGVHLSGNKPKWRWDRRQQSMVQIPQRQDH